jgi:hypothetical protein
VAAADSVWYIVGNDDATVTMVCHHVALLSFDVVAFVAGSLHLLGVEVDLAVLHGAC